VASSRICMLHPEKGHEWAFPLDNDDYEVFAELAGRRLGDSWKPVRMELLRWMRGERPLSGSFRRHADMPWIGSEVLLLRDEAVDVVGEILRPHGEVLPLDCGRARMAVFTASPVAGVLDHSRSSIERLSTGTIFRIRRPAFRLSVLGNVKAFALPEISRACPLLFAGDLVDEIVSTGKTSGTVFVPVYEERDGQAIQYDIDL